MRWARLAYESACIVALLCVAFAVMPLWWAWLAWEWRRQRGDAITTGGPHRTARHDTGPVTNETEAA
jgi:hypothetical protein